MSLAKKIEFSDPTAEGPELKRKTFDKFSAKIHEIAGVNLPWTDKNISLVRNRLSKVLRKEGLANYEELADKLENPSKAMLEIFISALTTNKTHFFREEAHFDFLANELKTHFDRHQDLRLWCAAASTGQEPYTLAMVIKENVPPQYHHKCKMLATDIDLEVLGRAVKGVYTSAETEGVPSWLRTKYFDASKDKTSFRAKDDLAKMIHFARFNLVQNSYEFQKPFHYVFCRNVLIYFDPPTTKKVINGLASTLIPGGYLVLGHSESGTVSDPTIKALSQAIYKKL
jgi:chemotaxis protein methyltransferase CheR